jgi:LysR family transcriptional regulator, carnitine catabolism transcriptional activator
MMDYTVRQLRAFLLVAQHRSFSRAAAGLFITPSALSVLIRELEAHLGVRLFDRTTRQVALTAHGEELYAVARRSLGELDVAVSQVGQSGRKAARSLSVGSPPLLAATLLAPAIGEFRSQKPDVRFQVFDGGTPVIMQKVESGALDLGVGIFFKHLPGLRRAALSRCELVVVCADDASAPKRATTTWSALKGERLISLAASIPLQQFADHVLAKAGIASEPAMVVNYPTTQIALAEAGEGVAIIPSYALPYCRNRKIAVSRLVSPVVRLDLQQIWRAGRKLPPVAEEFTSFLRNYIESSAGGAGIV